MNTPTVIFALIALFAAPAFADHNRTSLPLGLGQKEGHWTEISENGDVFEGYYVDGERRGPRSARFANGFIVECVYAKDADHCLWVMRHADGDELGDHSGQFLWRFANSDMLESPFLDGKKHGQWVWRSADGSVNKRCFENGNEEGC